MKNKLSCSVVFALPLLVNTCKDTKLVPCFDTSQLKQRWRNEYTLVQDCNANDVVISSYRIYPSGIFKLNVDGTYNVVSDEVPLNGTWEISTGCKITLDGGNSNKRTFVIQKLSADSLTISRKDPGTLVIYTQHYSRN